MRVTRWIIGAGNPLSSVIRLSLRNTRKKRRQDKTPEWRLNCDWPSQRRQRRYFRKKGPSWKEKKCRTCDVGAPMTRGQSLNTRFSTVVRHGGDLGPWSRLILQAVLIAPFFVWGFSLSQGIYYTSQTLERFATFEWKSFSEENPCHHCSEFWDRS